MQPGFMGRRRHAITTMVLLIGNYLPDQQQSMLRFNEMMVQGLRERGVETQLIRAPAMLGRIQVLGATVAKWLGYIDKFVLFRWRLWRKLAQRPAVIHICDHSNAPYALAARHFPIIRRHQPAGYSSAGFCAAFDVQTLSLAIRVRPPRTRNGLSH